MRHSPLLVSIVTPSYNSLPYIKETIESVRMQDYSSIEHIIIDGSSTDGTREYIQSQPNLTWISEPDKGQSDALNKGFRLARGDIIGWLNADDIYWQSVVSMAVNFLETNPDVDLVYGDIQIIDAQSAVVGVSRSESFDLERLFVKNYINQPTIFMRRRILDALGGVNTQLHYVMDWEFWLRAGFAGFKMHYLENQIMAQFRLAPGTKSFDKTPHFHEEWLKVLAEIFQSALAVGVTVNVKQHAIRRVQSRYHTTQMVKAINSKKRKKMASHLLQAIKYNPTLITNRGTWFFVFHSLFGFNIDRYRKYKKAGGAEKAILSKSDKF